MQMPYSLSCAIEQLAQTIDYAQLLREARALSERYRARTGGRQAVMEPQAVAYAASRMPATFAAVQAALGWALATAPRPIRTLLDVGAGTGAACWAAQTHLNLERVTCLECEGAMAKAGQKLMAAAGFSAQVDWRAANLVSDVLPDGADLVIAAYVFNELDEPDRASALKRLWEKTGQMLLIIEPGTPDGYARILSARENLMAAGAVIAAPCPHQLACPLPVGDWCHFSCRLPRSRLHRQLKGGDAPYEDEKFCYLAAVRNQPSKCSLARVLRHPLTEKGRVTLNLCAADGLSRRCLTKSMGESYKRAKKARWGDDFDPR